MKATLRVALFVASAAFTVTAPARELLTGKNGMTLYTSSEDRPGQSTCSWYCIRVWPPAYEGEAEGPEFGALTREGGARQLTYAGKPLYYFIGDRNPGDANGSGIDQAWQVVPLPPYEVESRRAAAELGERAVAAGIHRGRPFIANVSARSDQPSGASR